MSNNYRHTGEGPLINIQDIRNASIHEEIDYLFLKSILRNYSRPPILLRLFKRKYERVALLEFR
jgi:hypothetical protein